MDASDKPHHEETDTGISKNPASKICKRCGGTKWRKTVTGKVGKKGWRLLWVLGLLVVLVALFTRWGSVTVGTLMFTSGLTGALSSQVRCATCKRSWWRLGRISGWVSIGCILGAILFIGMNITDKYRMDGGLQGAGNIFLGHVNRTTDPGKALTHYQRYLDIQTHINSSSDLRDLILVDLEYILDRCVETEPGGEFGWMDYYTNFFFRYEEAGPVHKLAMDLFAELTFFDSSIVWIPHFTDDELVSRAKNYETRGLYARAESVYKRTLAIREKLQNEHTVTAMDGLAEMYVAMGRYAEAEVLYQRSLAIREKVVGPEHAYTAASLNNLAWLYDTTGRYAEAEPLFKRALAISEKVLDPEHANTATLLVNLAGLYENTGRYGEAEPLYQRAISIREKRQDWDKRVTANFLASLDNLARLYEKMDRYAEADSLHKRALVIREESLGLDQPFTAASLLFEKQGKPEVAIFFGKQVVNTILSLRQNKAWIDMETLKAFNKRVEKTYKRLSNLLIDAGRLPEAQQVMELLKQKEYFEYVQQDAREKDVMAGRVTYTGIEASLDFKYHQAADPLVKLGAERSKLTLTPAAAGFRECTPDQDARLTELNKDMEKAGEAFQQVIDEITRELSEKRQNKIQEIEEAQRLQDDLRELSQGTVALYTLISEEKYRVMLIAPDFRKTYQSDISEKDLNQKITAFRELLQYPLQDPRPLAKELYDLIIGPAVPDLITLNAKTLMWSLDGALRYLPVSALYDGKHYLTETYQSVVFTPAINSGLKKHPKPAWNGLGLGVSKAHPGFSKLNAVITELYGIFRTEASPQGVVPGVICLDNDFTLDAMKRELQKHYPLVHIASHFHLIPGEDYRSFLLLGNELLLPPDYFKKQKPPMFSGVELLTMSACNTSVGDGKEVEGFGVLAQRHGAKAVIATLWLVDDASTGIFMQNFYRLREQENLSKAEALQRAQLLFITGGTQATPVKTVRATVAYTTPEGRDVPAAPFTSNPAAPYSHPYYWAPFFLMGNWL